MYEVELNRQVSVMSTASHKGKKKEDEEEEEEAEKEEDALNEEGAEENKGDDEVDIVQEIWGEVGRFPFFVNVLIALMNFSIAWQMLSMPFLAPKTLHWCQQPNHTKEIWSDVEWKIISSPFLDDGKIDRCSMYDVSNVTSRADAPKIIDLPIVPCTEFTYDLSFWKETAVSKWDLICSNSKWAKSYSNSIFMSGVAVGVFVSGLLSDHFGRKPTMFGLMLLKSVSGLAAAYIDGFGYWVAVRWITYACSMSLLSVKYVLSMELLSGQHRLTFGMGMFVTYALGICTFPGVCYLLRDFFWIQIVMAATNAVFLLCVFVVPESPRWLISRGKYKEAKAVLERGARFMGGKGLPDKFELEDMSKKKKAQEEGPKPNLLTLFSTGQLARYTIAMYLMWFANGFVYYGIGLNIGDIGGDLFINYFIFGAVDVPGFLFTVVVLTYMNRRPAMLTFMLICGGCLVSTCFFSKGDYKGDWPIVTLAMIGKFCLTISFTSIYSYTVEIYPTLLRNIALGSGSTFARVGSIIAPMTFVLSEINEQYFPTGLLGTIFLVCALSVVLLPETRGRPLPATMEEMERDRKGQAKCWIPFCSKDAPSDN